MENKTEMELCNEIPVKKNNEEISNVKLQNHVLIMWVKQQTIVHFLDSQSSHVK